MFFILLEGGKYKKFLGFYHYQRLLTCLPWLLCRYPPHTSFCHIHLHHRPWMWSEFSQSWIQSFTYHKHFVVHCYATDITHGAWKTLKPGPLKSLAWLKYLCILDLIEVVVDAASYNVGLQSNTLNYRQESQSLKHLTQWRVLLVLTAGSFHFSAAMPVPLPY